MITRSTLGELFRHNDECDRIVFEAAARLSDEQLDRPLDLGLGSVRRICRHVLAGEEVWLSRIKDNVETPWPNEKLPLPIATMLQQLERVWAERDAFIRELGVEALVRTQTYRDSKGSLFEATLHEMLIQDILHAAHHRAQIVNGIRRVGGEAPEVDYMYLVRKPK